MMPVPRPTAEQFDNIVGTGAVAELLGVSKQRVSDLAREHATFPDPIHRLPGVGPLYWLPEIIEWEGTWDRRPGRRRKAPKKREETYLILG